MGSPIQIRTGLLAALARYASTDETRPQLGSVLFRPGEIVVTNGHIMIRAVHKTTERTFAISREACFAAIAAQDAMARHHSEHAMRLGVDIEATDGGDSILMETISGDRVIFIHDEGSAIRFDLGQIQMTCATVDLGRYPYPDIEKAADVGRGKQGPAGFSTSYLDALDLIARAAGYFDRGARFEAYDSRGAQWIIPPDPQPDDEPVRVTVMAIMLRDEAEKAAKRDRRLMSPLRRYR